MGTGRKILLLSLLVPIVAFALISSSYSPNSQRIDPRFVSEKIATISASFLYTLNKPQLAEILKADVLKTKEIRGVRIIDLDTDEDFFSYYFHNDKPSYDSSIPQVITVLPHASSNVVFNGILIGKVEVYVDNSYGIELQNTIEEDFEYKIRFLLVLFGSLFVIMIAIIITLFKKSRSDDNPLRFGKKSFSYAVMSAMITFSAVSIIGGWTVLDQNKINVERHLNEMMDGFLSSAFLDLRFKANESLMQFDDVVRTPSFSNKLYGYVEARKPAVRTERRKEIEHLVGQDNKVRMIFDRTGVAMFDSNISAKDVAIDRSANGAFMDALGKERTSITASFYEDSAIFFNVSPIFDEHNNVIAVYYVEVTSELENVFASKEHSFGKTGEVLLFSSEGEILSETRFEASDEQLLSFGKQVINSNSFHEGQLNKITGYDGNEALLMSRWYEEANIGIAASVDLSEAYYDVNSLRFSVSAVMLAMLSFNIPFTLLTLHVGRKSNEKVRASRYEIISRLGHAAEFKDNETANHIQRISLYSRVIGQKLPVSKAWIEILCDAAPMHDIGKIGIPDHILGKPGKLDESEWKVMRSHPKFGAEIIGVHPDSELLTMAREVALSHHEKWDGTGYPYGLKGEKIPLSARIVAIADVFDALTQERVYKRAWSEEEAFDFIRDNSGKHFDPAVVNAFFSAISEVKKIRRYHSDPI